MHIKIDLKIFAFSILFIFTKQIEIYLLLILFAILHELGHLICGVILKLKPKLIELNCFGLSITFEGIGENYSKKSIKNRFLIAISGPFVNLIFILIACICPIGNMQMAILYVNLMLLLVNLMPMYPLDGGRILKILLHKKFGYWQSLEITNYVSNVLAIALTMISSILILYMKNIAMLFMCLYLIILTINENKKFKMLTKMKNAIKSNNSILEKSLV